MKDAVRRFRVGEEDADASILFPRETVSPGKGKAKARDDPVSTTPFRPSLRDKGKQRAREEEGDGYGYVHDAGMSGKVRVRGKEEKLVEATAEQMVRDRWGEHDRDGDWEEGETGGGRDKERIRMLEGEIRKLKEEVGNFFCVACY